MPVNPNPPQPILSATTAREGGEKPATESHGNHPNTNPKQQDTITRSSIATPAERRSDGEDGTRVEKAKKSAMAAQANTTLGATTTVAQHSGGPCSSSSWSLGRTSTIQELIPEFWLPIIHIPLCVVVTEYLDLEVGFKDLEVAGFGLRVFWFQKLEVGTRGGWRDLEVGLKDLEVNLFLEGLVWDTANSLLEALAGNFVLHGTMWIEEFVWLMALKSKSSHHTNETVKDFAKALAFLPSLATYN
uniref:Uncharacterized protein n=1 Tax=Fagus sylvatica TaxID=28930 RepID=A0A2N9II61_FAGSY